jgi:ABC-type sugar transport system substrate-binding protein
VAREAAEAGIAWVVLNRRASFLERLPSEYPELPIFAVSPDDIEIGKIQGRQLRAVLPRGGRALLVRGGTATSTTTERDAGLRSALRGAGIELDVLYGSWTQQAARNALDVYLRTPGRGARRLDAVVCQSDEIAVGTLAALHAAAERQLRPELERIPVLGCDGLPSVGRSLVTNGSLRATVLVPSTTGPAIDTLARAFTCGITPPAELVLKCVPFPA